MTKTTSFLLQTYKSSPTRQGTEYKVSCRWLPMAEEKLKMSPLRILIADEQDLVRRGLKLLVESHPGWNICAEARTGREAVSAARELKPDVAILALSMPEWNGLEATKRIRKTLPNTDIIHGSFRTVRSRNSWRRGSRLYPDIGPGP
jgi:CheY-like chemotaxis protein